MLKKTNSLSKSNWQHYNTPQNLIILVAALGYFVDIYDLILFSIIRKASLDGLNIPVAEQLQTGIDLLNYQMLGMLVGGVLWGILGDTRGRLSVLFGSIFLYSAANFANGFVQDITTYSIIRFIAGVGLAGELGAGITMVSEMMDKEKRGWGTMIVVVFGALGAVLAALVGGKFDWRISYFVGGGLGLMLLLLRVGTYESGMFKEIKDQAVRKGAFLQLFRNRQLLKRYLSCIIIGLPVWFTIGILIVFSPEISEATHVQGKVVAGSAIMFAYIGLSVGDLISGVLSQVLRSRKKVVVGFVLANFLISVAFLCSEGISVNLFYLYCFLLGTATGFWALFVTIASEQFGTNIRSTVTTTVPNFVRGAVVPMTLSFKALIPILGIFYSALGIGAICTILALLATWSIHESFGKDLNYLETM